MAAAAAQESQQGLVEAQINASQAAGGAAAEAGTGAQASGALDITV